MRVTAGIIVNAEGNFGPLFIILKHSKSSAVAANQLSMTVIKNLFKRDKGYGITDGWELHVWTKELTTIVKKKTLTQIHSVYYIIHKKTGHVITSQFKAWNDTVRMCMFIELICVPLISKRGKMLIWSDNCSVHKTVAVESCFQEHKILNAFYPPNCTGILQVLDLVVNGPIKRHMRMHAAQHIYDEFQKFRDKFQSLNETEKKESIFEIPKVSLERAMKNLFRLFEEEFITPKMKQSISKSFIDTSSIYNSNKEFITYTQSKDYIRKHGTVESYDYHMHNNEEQDNYNEEDIDFPQEFLDGDLEDEWEDDPRESDNEDDDNDDDE